MAGVRLESLTKSFGPAVTAVDRLDLDVADGEFLVLLGPSGCGKTTTLRLIAGLETASTGRIHIGGRCVNDVAPADRGVAMVFQDHVLFPHMTVRDNIGFAVKMRGLGKSEVKRRVDHAAALLSLDECLSRQPRELSGGQQQRVALAAAIVTQPQVFLFDEPLSNLDAALRVQARTEIARLHRELKATTLYVTHDQTEAMTLGDRIAVMNQGVVQQVAVPLNVYRRPANQFVAGFIGAPAMNFVTGSVDNGVFRPSGAGEEIEIALPSETPAGSVVLGVRPEDVLVNDPSVRMARSTVDLVERLGEQTLVHFELLGSHCVARVDAARDVAVASIIEIGFRAGACHFFANDATGVRLG